MFGYLERRMRHICKMVKLEVRAVIKCLCKKVMPPQKKRITPGSENVILYQNIVFPG